MKPTGLLVGVVVALVFVVVTVVIIPVGIIAVVVLLEFLCFFLSSAHEGCFHLVRTSLKCSFCVLNIYHVEITALSLFCYVFMTLYLATM